MRGRWKLEHCQIVGVLNNTIRYYIPVVDIEGKKDARSRHVGAKLNFTTLLYRNKFEGLMMFNDEVYNPCF